VLEARPEAAAARPAVPEASREDAAVAR